MGSGRFLGPVDGVSFWGGLWRQQFSGGLWRQATVPSILRI